VVWPQNNLGTDDEMQMNVNPPRVRWLVIFLWISVFAWGIGLGAKLFELVVLIPAWAANPPASLSLLPYGQRWPFNPGDFFQPLSVLLVIGTLGALVSGWNASRTYKAWLWASLISLLVIWVATPTLFWPMILDLYAASTGSLPMTEAAAQSLAAKWIVYDWIRAVFIAVGFACAVRAINTAHRAHAA
jgi:Domain of unknown function (DUF1772)